ncbi:hypothetical protein A2U01_0104417, partial [Trifolium medium]|nr:hypothetical protein [Trifolium medium]
LSLLFLNYSSVASPSKANAGSSSGSLNTEGIQGNVASETNTSVNSPSESVIQTSEAKDAEEGGLVGEGDAAGE